MLRAVELAGPWKVVALLRLGPFPYHWLNYALVRLPGGGGGVAAAAGFGAFVTFVAEGLWHVSTMSSC
jgi:hypothetical protein